MQWHLDIRRVISLSILFAFLANTFGPVPVVLGNEFHLPAPGTLVHLSPRFGPPILKGIKVHPENPFRFDFILDKGDVETPLMASLQNESIKLIKYFLASLTIPEKDLWVNLSPYEKNRIIPEAFGQTQMGRDLLAEDYMLKQITASLICPEDSIGKKFWKRVYKEAIKKFGTTNIPVNTFNKVWILPDKAVVYEDPKASTAYVVESKLKVMLEQDYLSLEKNTVILPAPPLRGLRRGPGSATKDLNRINSFRDSSATPQNDVSTLGSQVIREIVIPELTKEVNTAKNFAQLRQVYNSLILASWYKKKIKESILTQAYAGKNKIAGININDPREKEKIYQRYLQAFKKGVFNYIKVEPGLIPAREKVILPRKYFSGGALLIDIDSAMSSTTSLPKNLNDSKNFEVLSVKFKIAAQDHSQKVNRDPAMSAYQESIMNTIAQTINGQRIPAKDQKGSVIGNYEVTAVVDADWYDPSENRKRVYISLQRVDPGESRIFKNVFSFTVDENNEIKENDLDLMSAGLPQETGLDVALLKLLFKAMSPGKRIEGMVMDDMTLKQLVKGFRAGEEVGDFFRIENGQKVTWEEIIESTDIGKLLKKTGFVDWRVYVGEHNLRVDDAVAMQNLLWETVKAKDGARARYFYLSARKPMEKDIPIIDLDHDAEDQLYTQQRRTKGYYMRFMLLLLSAHQRRGVLPKLPEKVKILLLGGSKEEVNLIFNRFPEAEITVVNLNQVYLDMIKLEYRGHKHQDQLHLFRADARNLNMLRDDQGQPYFIQHSFDVVLAPGMDVRVLENQDEVPEFMERIADQEIFLTRLGGIIFHDNPYLIRKVKRVLLKMIFINEPRDPAMDAESSTGGIDWTRVPVKIRNNFNGVGPDVQFDLNPAMLTQLQKSSGITISSLTIQSLKESLQQFLTTPSTP